MNMLRLDLERDTNFFLIYSIFVFIVVVNIMTISSPFNLLITLPQYGLVVFYLMKGDIKNSVLLHFMFVALGLSAQGTLGMMESMDFKLYNYSGLKLIGPVRVCYFMNIVYVLALFKSKCIISKDSLFYKFYKTVLLLCTTAGIIGIFGLLLHPYYSLDGFVSYGVYAFVVVTSLYIITKVATNAFIVAVYHCVLAGIMAGIMASFLCYVFGGIISHYSVFDIVYMSDITILAMALFIGIPMVKQRFLLWISIGIYFFLELTTLGGKGIFFLFFAICALLYLLFFDKGTRSSLRSKWWIRPMVIIMGVIAFVVVIRTVEVNSMAGYKFMSAVSMFTGDIADMSDSPYIRVASLINIINDGLSNPLALFFGNGYGGYFEDKLHLFAGIDLTNGAWKDDVIATGRFTSGHDTLVTVPLFNGLIGTYLLLKVCFQYLKKIPYNYLNSTAFFWVLMMFYFNTNFAYIGVVALIAAEYNINGYMETNHKRLSLNKA